MYDKKTIRRRRGVLLLLVVVSLVLLTDYFGESPSSPLHSVQRGVVEVLSPVQSAASTVFSPVRDVAGYFSSLVRAKSQNAQLVRDNQALRKEVGQEAYNSTQFDRDQRLLNLDQSLGLSQYHPTSAKVIGYNPSVWYNTIEVDKGTDSGVHEYDPVVGPGGLVGDVSEAGSSTSEVTLLTAPNFAVGAMVMDGKNDASLLEPSLGSPGTLVLGPLSTSDPVLPGQQVVTSGFKDPGDSSIHSLYPPGIPIGEVSNQNAQSTVVTNGTVDVTLANNLTRLSVVQILTDPHG